MRTECNAFFFNFAHFGKRIHLVAAAIGQYRSGPSVEPMKSAGTMQYIQSGPQVQMVGVAEDDLCVHGFDQFMLMHRFYGTRCSHGHKNRRFNDAMCGLHETGTCLGLAVCCLKREFHFRTKIAKTTVATGSW